MKKNLILKVAGVVTTLALSITALAGCGSNSAEVLNIYNWGLYMDPEVIEEFETETGIPVVYSEFNTNEDMYLKVKNGAEKYDLIFPSDYMIERMIKEDMLNEIDFSGMEYIDQIDPNYRNLSYDPEGKYSIPFTLGTVGIVYDTTKITEPITSWSVLFDEKYKKEILMLNSSRDTIGVALKYLGYSMNTRNEDELMEAKELLMKQKPLVLAYVVDEVRDMMISGEASLALVYAGEGMMIEQADPKFKYVCPLDEGSNIFVDGLAIPKTAENQDWAEQFINFLCRPDIAAKNAEYIGYATPLKGAQEALGEEVVNNKNNYPTPDMMDKLEFFKDPSDVIALYDRVWTEILSN